MSAGFFAQHFPKLGPDLTDGTPYTTNLHVFLRPWMGSMNIKNPRVNESRQNQKNAHNMRRGGLPLHLSVPFASTFSVGCAPKSEFLGSSLKVVPRHSEDFLVSFWTEEKPYKCIGSK